MSRIYHYDAVTDDEAQRLPSALLRAMSLSNGIWTSYEAFTIGRPGEVTVCLGKPYQLPLRALY